MKAWSHWIWYNSDPRQTWLTLVDWPKETLLPLMLLCNNPQPKAERNCQCINSNIKCIKSIKFRFNKNYCVQITTKVHFKLNKKALKKAKLVYWPTLSWARSFNRRKSTEMLKYTRKTAEKWLGLFLLKWKWKIHLASPFLVDFHFPINKQLIWLEKL